MALKIDRIDPARTALIVVDMQNDFVRVGAPPVRCLSGQVGPAGAGTHRATPGFLDRPVRECAGPGDRGVGASDRV